MNNDEFRKLLASGPAGGGGGGGDDDAAYKRKKKRAHVELEVVKGAGGRVDRKQLLEALDREDQYKRQRQAAAGAGRRGGFADEEDEDEEGGGFRARAKAGRAEEGCVRVCV
jgi:hypothetical protein